MNFPMINRYRAGLAALLAACCLTVSAQTTAFTYQGKLTDAGNPANGNFDLQFKLFDTATVGTGIQQGATLTNPTVVVSNGVFTVTLDFGANVFSGANRFLEIGVRPAGSVNPYTVLAPRQAVLSTPYAIQSLSAVSATTAVSFSGALAGDVSGTQGATVISNNAVTTAKIADSAVTSQKIAPGQVVKSLNSLTDNVTLAAGSNISITPSGNTLTIATTGGGVGGSGVANILPIWTGASLLGNSAINQLGSNIGIGTGAPGDKLTVQTATSTYGFVHTDGTVSVGTFVGGSTGGGWYGTKSNHPLSFFTNNSGAALTIGTTGSVSIGTNTSSGQLTVANLATGDAVNASASAQGGTAFRGVAANGAGAHLTGGSYGVIARSFGTGVGLYAENTSQGGLALQTRGSSWFTGDTTPLNAATTGSGTGIVVGSSGTLGYISAFDYSVNAPRTLLLNNGGGNVGIGLNNPNAKLHVTGSSPTAASIRAEATGSSGIGVYGSSLLGIGVLGEGSGSSDGVTGQTTSGTGVDGFSSFGRGVEANVISQGAIALKTSGTSFFKGDTTPLSVANAGSGMGIAIGTSGTLGYISAFDYSTNQTGTLLLNNGGGRVGINTNTPDQALSVSGNASKSVGGTTWAVFSDERLKNIKGRFTPGLAALMQLQPIRFEYKPDNPLGLSGGGEAVGFSAQAVEKVLPEAVSLNQLGYLQLHSDPILWTMLNAIKEQQHEIEQLKEQVRQLRASPRKRNNVRRPK